MAICGRCSGPAKESGNVCHHCVENVGRGYNEETEQLDKRVASLEQAMERLEARRREGWVTGEQGTFEEAERAEREQEERVKKAREAERSAERAVALRRREAERIKEEEEGASEEAGVAARKTEVMIQRKKCLESRSLRAERLANRLASINPLFEAFRVTPSESPGPTVNNLRLTKGNSREDVPWRESNAAWGHLVLLLSAIDGIGGLQEAGASGGRCYTPFPMGSRSRILASESLGKKVKEVTHELWGPPNPFSNAFDRAMAAFNSCVSEMATHAPPGFHLPHRAEGSQVGNAELKLSLSGEKFAASLRLLLENVCALQWFASSHAGT